MISLLLSVVPFRTTRQQLPPAVYPTAIFTPPSPERSFIGRPGLPQLGIRPRCDRAVESRSDLASRHGSMIRIAAAHSPSYRSGNPICTRPPRVNDPA